MVTFSRDCLSSVGLSRVGLADWIVYKVYSFPKVFSECVLSYRALLCDLSWRFECELFIWFVLFCPLLVFPDELLKFGLGLKRLLLPRDETLDFLKDVFFLWTWRVV